MGSCSAACACGQTRFEIHGAPLLRAYCHCTICQAFNQAAYADVTLFRARDVSLPPEPQVRYRSWQAPGLVLRGLCRDCGKPALEKVRLPGLPKTILVPSANLEDEALRLPPAMHIFYHSRVAEVDDDLPKYSGYLPSQLAYMRQMIPALFRGAA